jgi:hypothetical protein
MDDGREFPTTKRHFLSWLLPQLPSDNYVKKSVGRQRDCNEKLQPPFYLFSRLYRPNCVIRKVLVLLLVLFPKRRPMGSLSSFLFCVIFFTQPSLHCTLHFIPFQRLCNWLTNEATNKPTSKPISSKTSSFSIDNNRAWHWTQSSAWSIHRPPNLIAYFTTYVFKKSSDLGFTSGYF